MIKAEAKIYINRETGQASSEAEENEIAECIQISLDISIDGPEHSGVEISFLVSPFIIPFFRTGYNRCD